MYQVKLFLFVIMRHKKGLKRDQINYSLRAGELESGRGNWTTGAR